MNSAKQRIVLAGFGNMGRALAAGWLEAGMNCESITVVDPVAAARNRATVLGLDAAAAPGEIAAPIDIAVLAVKPAELDTVLAALPQAGLYLSIAAGRSIGEIARTVGEGAAIVRAMPNTPAAIGLGVTGLCASATATEADRVAAETLMAAVGTVEWLDNEADMDALTAVSGSGPAYVFLLIECLTAAAIDAGLNPGLAERLATATVRGAGAYAATSGVDAATLRRQVTSPKGTTEAALEVLLDRDALKALIQAAVRAATRRSQELRQRA
jgi:pyrroline-5-carboxylate reductase